MENSIEERIVKLLKSRGETVSTAESCTGGLTAATLINAPGASEVFSEGYITYSNEAKERLLGVSHETLSLHGAVSSETAAEMAAGCARAAGSAYAVATTGIAGPDGGTDEKPVGLVYVGCFARGEVRTLALHLEGSRMRIRQTAARRALEFLLWSVENL